MIPLIFLLSIINIKIIDRESGSPLKDVIVKSGNKFYISDSNGIVTIEEPFDSLILYKEGYKKIVIKSKVNVIYMEKIVYELSPIEVKAKREREGEIIPSQKLKNIPNFLNDPLRAINFLPSVTSFNEIWSLPYIRGDKRVIVYLDKVPLIYFTHFFGIMSIFDIEQIKNIRVYPSFSIDNSPDGIAGKIEINTDEGNLKKKIRISMIDFSISYSFDFLNSNFLFNSKKSFIHKLIENRKFEELRTYPFYEDYFLKFSKKINPFEITTSLIYSSEQTDINYESSNPYFIYADNNLYLFKTNLKLKNRFNLTFFGERLIKEMFLPSYDEVKTDELEIKGINMNFEIPFNYGFNYYFIGKEGEYIIYLNKLFSIEPFYLKTGIEFYKQNMFKKFIIQTTFNNFLIETGYGENFFPFADTLNENEHSKNYFISASRKLNKFSFKITSFIRMIENCSMDLIPFIEDGFSKNYAAEYKGIEFEGGFKFKAGEFLISWGIIKGHMIDFFYNQEMAKLPLLTLNFIYISPEIKGAVLSLFLKYAYGNKFFSPKGFIWSENGYKYFIYYEGYDKVPPYLRLDLHILKKFKNWGFTFDIINLTNRNNVVEQIVYTINDETGLRKEYVYSIPRIFSLGIFFSF